MKKFLKNYRHLIALASVLSVAILGAALGVLPQAGAVGIVGLWQLSQFAQSKRCGVCYVSALTPEQMDEFSNIMRKLESDYPQLKKLPDQISQLERLYDGLKSEVNRFKKSALGGIGQGRSGLRWVNGVPFIDDEAAKALITDFLLDVDRLPNASARLFPDEAKRNSMLQQARSFAGIQQRAGGALSTSDIPLPTIYVPQIVELVFAYGAARQYATIFPLGAGTVKLPRLKAGEDTFAAIGVGTAGMSQSVAQKEVQAELVTFTANKIGGR